MRACFVIAPIGEPESETRKRSDKVLKHVIRPSVEQCGYRAERADELAEPGLITNKIIQRIVDDPLVVADLTERNPNVFYELALRHALRKPLVQLIRKGDPLPFDVAGMRTISVDHHDLDSVDDAKAEIVRQIKSLEQPGTRIETPVSVALELHQLRESDKPEQRTLGEILAAVGEVRTSLAALEQQVSDSTSVLDAATVAKYMILAAILAKQTDKMSPEQIQQLTDQIRGGQLLWLTSDRPKHPTWWNWMQHEPKNKPETEPK